MNSGRIIYTLVILMLCLSPGISEAETKRSAPELNKTGMYYLKKGDSETASEYFMHAIIIDPSNKYYCNNMAASLMRRGDYAGAEKFLFHAVKLDGNYTRALSNMSVALFHMGRYREAYSFYVRSLNSDRMYTEARFERGRVKAAIKKISHNKPEDENLKMLLEYLCADSDK